MILKFSSKLYILIKLWNDSKWDNVHLEVFRNMLRIPRNILSKVGVSNSENQANIPIDLNLADSGFTDEEISLTSLNDVEWATNAMEPDQQRGPSETP